jgi:hypothetical protein
MMANKRWGDGDGVADSTAAERALWPKNVAVDDDTMLESCPDRVGGCFWRGPTPAPHLPSWCSAHPCLLRLLAHSHTGDTGPWQPEPSRASFPRSPMYGAFQLLRAQGHSDLALVEAHWSCECLGDYTITGLDVASMVRNDDVDNYPHQWVLPLLVKLALFQRRALTAARQRLLYAAVLDARSSHLVVGAGHVVPHNVPRNNNHFVEYLDPANPRTHEQLGHHALFSRAGTAVDARAHTQGWVWRNGGALTLKSEIWSDAQHDLDILIPDWWDVEGWTNERSIVMFRSVTVFGNPAEVSQLAFERLRRHASLRSMAEHLRNLPRLPGPQRPPYISGAYPLQLHRREWYAGRPDKVLETARKMAIREPEWPFRDDHHHDMPMWLAECRLAAANRRADLISRMHLGGEPPRAQVREPGGHVVGETCGWDRGFGTVPDRVLEYRLYLDHYLDADDLGPLADYLGYYMPTFYQPPVRRSRRHTCTRLHVRSARTPHPLGYFRAHDLELPCCRANVANSANVLGSTRRWIRTRTRTRTT